VGSEVLEIDTGAPQLSRGLLGILMVVVILGVTAALTVSRLTSTGITVPPGLFPTTTHAGGSGGPVTPAGPISIDRAALATACNADADSVENAVQLYEAQIGMPPPDLAALSATSTSSGQSGGPWLRALPRSTHYTIYVDSHGTVGVFPPGASPAGMVPAADDYGQHHDLCGSVPR